ncbi:MAG: HD domain-containing protein [Desulfovibrio sp.]|jgi:putative hydrolase of HD superfamily|nr:HD domain-containing protein [Desulfovibrio sp.]
MTTPGKSLLELVFSGAYMRRWNDKLRPMDFQEIDKQGHKMLLAFVFWHNATFASSLEERLALAVEIIEGGLFDYFFRLVVTDIKPPVLYRIMENREHYRQLTEYVLGRLRPMLSPTESFWDRMQAWHADGLRETRARRILKAAHMYASQWEFRLLKPLNAFDDEIEDIDASFRHCLEDLSDVAYMDPALTRFASLCGQLRFQIRWTQVSRIPATSVLGHMFIVAAYGYLYSLAIGACAARRVNDFFGGLMHDLPELLTRDIISPVKQSFIGLPELIKEYEHSEMDARILRPLTEAGHASLVERIAYLLGLSLGSEFQECVREDGVPRAVEDYDVFHRECNVDGLDPKDGGMLKACDVLAAFIEANSSIRGGVSSPHLVEAWVRLKGRLMEHPLKCLELERLLADFG